MAHFTVTYVSDAIKAEMNAKVIVPQLKRVRSVEYPSVELGSVTRGYPILMLLHDEASSPLELASYTSIERYADEAGIMVVIPEGHLSFFSNYETRDKSTSSGTGANNTIEMLFTEMLFENYVLEMLEYAQTAFPGSDNAKEHYIAGIGMGGFGALKLAFKHPDKFSKVASINGYTDLQWMMDNLPERQEQFQAIFGGLSATGENNLSQAALSLPDNEKPDIIQFWQQAGFSAKMNELFSQQLDHHYPSYSKVVDETNEGWDYLDERLSDLAKLLSKSKTSSLQEEGAK